MDKSSIFAAVCSQDSHFSIEANCLSKYFYRIEDGFESTLIGIGVENSKVPAHTHFRQKVPAPERKILTSYLNVPAGRAQ